MMQPARDKTEGAKQSSFAANLGKTVAAPKSVELKP